MKLRLGRAGLLALLAVMTGLSCRTAKKGPSPKLSFPDFPVGVDRTVSYDEAAGLLDGLSWRERRDQVRDWMLYSVTLSSVSSASRISRILYDVPPVRADYLRPVTHFAAGPTRSVYLEQGEVAVLVPVENESARMEDLAAAADEHRKNQGTPPLWLHVFQYAFRAGKAGVTVRRLAPVAAGTLYTAAYGYREQPLRNWQDLGAFLAAADDLTYVSMDGRGLTVGGRKLRAQPYRGIAPSVVAELYQADAKWRAARRREKDLVDQYNARWGSITYGTLDEKRQLEAEAAAAGREMERQREAIFREAGPQPASCGFSLDPFPEGAAQYQYQAARYICDLQGTETGMVLFYTDQLAKLWGLISNDHSRDTFPILFPKRKQKFRPFIAPRSNCCHSRAPGLLRCRPACRRPGTDCCFRGPRRGSTRCRPGMGEKTR